MAMTTAEGCEQIPQDPATGLGKVAYGTVGVPVETVGTILKYTVGGTTAGAGVCAGGTVLAVTSAPVEVAAFFTSVFPR